jgi:hypothetical protein
MYRLTDVYGDLLFKFENDNSILDAGNKRVGSVQNGVVCDSNGTPTRVTVQGNEIVWNGVNPGPVVSVTGNVIVDVGDGNTPAGIVVGTNEDAQRMIAAAAYWEFILSKT